MKAFFDTSVLVAACEVRHPSHAAALAALRRVTKGEDQGLVGAHSLAELFATLTRLPFNPKTSPAEAVRAIEDNVLQYFQVVLLDLNDYRSSLAHMAGAQLPGAQIYDRLLLGCAEKCAPDRVYTLNLSHFISLAPASLSGIISTP